MNGSTLFKVTMFGGEAQYCLGRWASTVVPVRHFGCGSVRDARNERYPLGDSFVLQDKATGIFPLWLDGLGFCVAPIPKMM